MTTKVAKRGRPPLPEGAGATSHLHMRISREQKSAYVRAAMEKKLKLSEWVTEKLDEAVSK